MILLIIWNAILTVFVVWLLFRTSIFTFTWPYIEIDKDGIWVGWRNISGSGHSYRIISFHKED